MPTLLITFGEADADAESHDRLARQLRLELAALAVDEVRLSSTGSAPPGAKGIAASTGELVVSLANSAAFATVLTSLVQVLRAWIARGQARHVILKDGERSLELTGASLDQQQQAVDAFVRSMTADGRLQSTKDDPTE